MSNSNSKSENVKVAKDCVQQTFNLPEEQKKTDKKINDGLKNMKQMMVMEKIKEILKNSSKMNNLINDNEKKTTKLKHILSLISNNDVQAEYKAFELIVDTGCTNSSSTFIDDFKHGSMKELDEPLVIEGINGNITVKQYGTLRWEHVTKKGEIVSLSHDGFFAPELSDI